MTGKFGTGGAQAGRLATVAGAKLSGLGRDRSQQECRKMADTLVLAGLLNPGFVARLIFRRRLRRLWGTVSPMAGRGRFTGGGSLVSVRRRDLARRFYGRRFSHPRNALSNQPLDGADGLSVHGRNDGDSGAGAAC